MFHYTSERENAQHEHGRIAGKGLRRQFFALNRLQGLRHFGKLAVRAALERALDPAYPLATRTLAVLAAAGQPAGVPTRETIIRPRRRCRARRRSPPTIAAWTCTSADPGRKGRR